MSQGSKDKSFSDFEKKLDEIERSLELSERLKKVEERILSGEKNKEKSPNVLLGLAFGAFGLLVGVMTGLTETEIVKPLIATLFAVFGGSIIAFLHKLSGTQQVQASIAIFMMSIALLIGVFSGIWIRHGQMLSPPGVTADYLRSDKIRACNEIDSNHQNGRIDLTQAYNRIFSVCVFERCEQIDSEYQDGKYNLNEAYEKMYSACLGEQE